VRRNEELRQLYEKIKVQGSTLRRGQAAYRDRLNEIRVLKIKVGVAHSTRQHTHTRLCEAQSGHRAAWAGRRSSRQLQTGAYLHMCFLLGDEEGSAAVAGVCWHRTFGPFFLCPLPHPLSCRRRRCRRCQACSASWRR
jgi:hypothetical protein